MNKKEFIYKIKNANALEISIGILIFVFIFSKIFDSFKLFRFSSIALAVNFNLSTDFWQFFTYGFFHHSFLDLFFNTVLLYYFGNIFLDFLTEKKFWLLFLIGIPFGGIFFITSYNLFPNMYIEKDALLGSSAGIMAIMTYISLYTPKYQIYIRFIGFVKLMNLLIAFIIYNLLLIPMGNPGGYFAHLGGLCLGFLMFMLDKVLKEKSIKDKKSNISIINNEKVSNNYKINTILDKINKSGYESLSQEEKDYLFRQGKN